MVLKQNIGVKWVKQQIKSFFSIQQFGLVLVIIVLDLTRCGCLIMFNGSNMPKGPNPYFNRFFIGL